MKLIATCLVYLACTFVARAQVTCSYEVKHEICRDASQLLIQQLVGPVEIVTPAEYTSRLSGFDEKEEALTVTFGNDRSVTDDKHFNIYHKHVLFQNFDEKISFIRNNPWDKRPSQILVSADEFEGREVTVVDGKVVTRFTGVYDPTTVSNLVYFAAGYMGGTNSTLLDGASRADQLARVWAKEKK